MTLEGRILLAAFNPLPNTPDGAPGSLRAAVIGANATPEDDVITLTAGTYHLTLPDGPINPIGDGAGDLDLRGPGRTITVQGDGRDRTIIDANDIDRVIEVHALAAVVLRGLTLLNGRVNNQSGGGIANAGNLTLIDAAVRDCVADFSTTFTAGGGGIYNAGSLTLRATEVTGNRATNNIGGGGIFSNGPLRIEEGSLIANNNTGSSSGGAGGGVRQAGGSLSIDGSAVRGNSAGTGGGLWVSPAAGSTAAISSSQINDNTAAFSAGGIYLAGQMSITGSSVSGNRIGTGTPPGSVQPGGEGSGTGIENSGNSVLTIENSTLADNRGAATGGGIRNKPGSTLTVRGSTISGNYGMWGGGLWNDIGATASVYSSTFSGNLARAGGGGINTSGTLRLQNVTVTANRSDYASQQSIRLEGGGITRDRGVAQVFNSIVVGNFSGGGGGNHNASVAQDAVTFSGTFSGVGNIFGQGGTGLSEADNRLFVGVAAAALDSQLRDNGGPTLTHVLLPNSIGVNTGNPLYTPFTDQRGLPINGRVDVGAYELQQANSSDWSYRVDASQFGPGDALVHGFGFDDGTPGGNTAPVFLGFEFDTGPLVLGRIVEGLFGDRYGGQIRADFSGRLGLELGFYINSGSLDLDYDGALNYVIDSLPDGTFNLGTFLSVDDGALYTVSPKLGAYADLVLEFDARIGATAAFVGTIGGDVSFGVDERIELFSINRQERDAAGNPAFYQDGTPIFDGDIRFAFEQLIEDAVGEVTESVRDARAGRQYQKANEDERQGRIDVDQGQRDLEKATTQQERDAAQQKINGGNTKIDDANLRRINTTQDVVKRKLGITSGLGVNFSEAAGSLLGVDATLTAGLAVDGVGSATKQIGTFTVTLPDVNLTGRDPDFRGHLSASTDLFTDPLQDARRQLAKLAIDIGGLLGPLIGLPTGKYNANLGGGLLDLTVQTVSYNLIPTLNVTQDVEAAPYARQVLYTFDRPVPVDVGDGLGFVTRPSVTITPGTNLRIRPNDITGDGVPDPVDVTPTVTLASRFTNNIGLDIDIDGAFEAFALELKVLDQSVVDVGPLITHNHRIGSVPLGNVFERTFDLPAIDRALTKFTISATARDGASPGTALTGTPSPVNPDVTSITHDRQSAGPAPLFIETPISDAGAGTAFRSVRYVFAPGTGITSVILFAAGLTVTADGQPAPTRVVLNGAVRHDFSNPTAAFNVSGFQDAQSGTQSDTALIGVVISQIGGQSITATRSDPVPLVDLNDPGIGNEGVDPTAVERNTARVVLNTLTIDLDGDGAASPLTDGLLVFRYLEGRRGDALVRGAVNPQGTRTTSDSIVAYVQATLMPYLDVDGDGAATAAVDGILIARYLAGFTGPALMRSINSTGSRTDPAAIRQFLSGSTITVTNDPVVLLDEHGNPRSSDGSGFEVPGIVDMAGGDPFGVEGALDAAPGATPGSSAARPAAAAGASAASAIRAAAGPASIATQLDFNLTTYGRTQAYDELYLRDGPGDPRFVSRVAAGSPTPFGGLNPLNLLDVNEVRSVSSRLIRQARTSTLGVDEPIFIEIPDAAGYTYQALGGFTFKTLDINPEFGGNLYLDRQFDLYLFDTSSGRWLYDTTITAGQRHAFAGGGVTGFQLFGLALANEALHRGSNQDAPALVTTTGFTLAGGAGGSPTIRLTEEAPRQRLNTPDDADRVGTGGFGGGLDLEFRVVRSGANAVLTMMELLNFVVRTVDTPQLASATDITILGDHHLDILVIDTSGGPLRIPLVFHGGDLLPGQENPRPDVLRIEGRGASIDLVNRDVITGVEQIDIRGTGANTLLLDANVVRNNTGTGQTLVVYANADDSVGIGSGWTLTGTEASPEGVLNVFTQAGATLKLSQAAGPAGSAAVAGAEVAPSGASTGALPAETSDRVSSMTVAAAAPTIAGALPRQVITVDPTDVIVPGAPLELRFSYATDSAAPTPGVHLRLHFDSSRLTFVQMANLFGPGLSTSQTQDDGAGGGLDGDPDTNQYLNVMWLDAAGTWPGGAAQPLALFAARFTAAIDFADSTTVRFTGNAAAGYELAAPPVFLVDAVPQVTAVYARGSTWAGPDPGTVTFKEYLEQIGLGDDVYGYRIYDAAANPQSNPSDVLPWINIDEIVLRYSSPPTGGGIPTPGTLALDGVRSDYTVTTVTQVDPRTFVLRLDRPLGDLHAGGDNGDRIRFDVPAGGPGGSTLQVRFNILRGDVDRNGAVLARDFSELKKKFFRNTAAPGPAGDTQYSVYHDLDGSGSILASDVSEVKKRFFDSLPPVAVATMPLFGTRRARPAGRASLTDLLV